MQAKVKRKGKKLLFSILGLLLLLVLYFYLIGPFLVILTNAFKTTSEINSAVPTFLPKNPVLSNFKELAGDQVFMQDIKNSFKISLITMVIAILLAIPTAYSMARFRNKLTSGMVVWVLLSQMIPGIITVVPYSEKLCTYEYPCRSDHLLCGVVSSVLVLDDEGIYRRCAKRAGGSGSDRWL